MLSAEELAEIRERAEAATPGPWFGIPNPDWSGANWRIARDANEPWGNFGQLAYVAPQNGPFIAHARTDIPALLSHIAAVEAQRDALVGLVEESIEMVGDWGDYAPDYFKQKHDLAGDIARVKAKLARILDNSPERGEKGEEN
jgi:hypothetical protein